MRRLGYTLLTLSVFSLAFVIVLSLTNNDDDDDSERLTTISGIRSTADGGLVITFLGAPPECATYDVSFDSSTDPVTASLRETEVATCTNVGDFRDLTVPPGATAFPDRFLDDASTGRLEVFDGASLAIPDPLPAGWGNIVESGDRDGNWAITYGTDTESVTVRQGPDALTDVDVETGTPEPIEIGSSAATYIDQGDQTVIYDVTGHPNVTLVAVGYPRDAFIAFATALLAT